MKKWFLPAIALVAALLAFRIAVPGSHGLADSEATVVSAVGVAQVDGQTAFVEVTLAVPRGLDEHVAAQAALREQGARPIAPRDLQSENFTTTGLAWDQFSDGDAGNDSVVQNYNPNGDPTGGFGDDVLLATHATWTDVPTSKFAFSYGGTTNRCPSLVRECAGPQVFDGFNDVGWGALSCNVMRCTLGVTWSSSSVDEADVWLNTAAAWHAGATACTNVVGQFDLQTVTAHEQGHVAGLGHSTVQAALMYARYQGAHCQLHQDDIDGITFLYPDGPAPTPTNTPDPAASPTPTPTPNCPPGHARRGLC
jgi:hypothetical protein